MLGTWVHAGGNERSKQLEVRQVAITSQQAVDLRGLYSFYGLADRPFTGRFTSDREVRLILDDGSTELTGIVPSAVTLESTEWPLAVTGGSASGETLSFVRVGEPTGPAPTPCCRSGSASRPAPRRS